MTQTVTHFLGRRRAEIPIYSFAKHAREKETTSIYSPHVLILEGILALYDPRVLQLLDMKVFISQLSWYRTGCWFEAQIFCEADADTCLSRRSRLSSFSPLSSFAKLWCSSQGRGRAWQKYWRLHQAVVCFCEAELWKICRASEEGCG